MGRHNFDDGATQLICWGDTTPMLGRRNFGWGDITWGDKAMGRHNLHSVNVVARKVYTREELFVIALRTTGGLTILSTTAWNLWVFLNIAADALVFLQSFAYRQIIKLSLPFVHGVVGMICVPHIIFDKRLVLLDWPGSLAIIWSPLKVKLRFLKYLLLNQLRPRSM